jgi:cyanate permease
MSHLSARLKLYTERFFLGLAFLAIGLAIFGSKRNKSIKNTVIICGVLCLAGFLGAIFINENLWYLAPMGYGLGTIVLCIQMIKQYK